MGGKSQSLVFRALADDTRRQILQGLRDGESNAGTVASRFPISGPSVSRHLGVLKAAGLVRERKEANRIYYGLERDQLVHVLGDFLGNVCAVEIVRDAKREGQP